MNRVSDGDGRYRIASSIPSTVSVFHFQPPVQFYSDVDNIRNHVQTSPRLMMAALQYSFLQNGQRFVFYFISSDVIFIQSASTADCPRDLWSRLLPRKQRWR